jgi:hypothetical protein
MQVLSTCRRAVKGEKLDFVARGSVVAGVCTNARVGARNNENDRSLRVALNPSARVTLKRGLGVIR